MVCYFLKQPSAIVADLHRPLVPVRFYQTSLSFGLCQDQFVRISHNVVPAQITLHYQHSHIVSLHALTAIRKNPEAHNSNSSTPITATAAGNAPCCHSPPRIGSMISVHMHVITRNII